MASGGHSKMAATTRLLSSIYTAQCYETARASAYCYCLNHVAQRPQVNGQWPASDRNLHCKLVQMIATSLIRHMHVPFKRVRQLV